ncbi:uncharacterized protein LOC111400436 [Olea europaea var. sylvestris]|uniref:uncharacterized protein LOC111400436 n=1 Tax=Olea europaea var. sylvestris TaxID=158386 RepID=UPI000C1D8BEA|nr:uncharacterized protein LOC111400436 [Olea europaea var. sylvestris]
MESSLRESLSTIHMQKVFMLIRMAKRCRGFQMLRQHMMLPDEPHILSCRDLECSIDTYLPSYSGLFGVKKEAGDNSKFVDIERQDGITINDYTNSYAQKRLPLCEQYSYHSYGNLSLPEMMEPEREVNFQASSMDYQIKPEREVKLQASTMGYQINGNFELPRFTYNDFVGRIL